MAKVPYIGVDGVARKCKSLYIGVDGVARKVKSGYIGVNGVARQFYCSAMPKPDGDAYLTFISPEVFSIKASKRWDGTLEYFTVDGTWTEWDGSSIQAKNGDDGYALYFRGTGNTTITANRISSSYKWSITGTDVQCIGNIETLLDYATVELGNHPAMNTACYGHMFDGCTCLTTAPYLPATTASNYCYTHMFQGCTGLTQAPPLPATTLGKNCYWYMFSGCTNLTTVPSLPATTFETRCYANMFENCEKIKLSTTNTGEYINAYRIPTSGTGTTSAEADYITDYMFTNTGGTFTGTPDINTTYYLSSSNEIV